MQARKKLIGTLNALTKNCDSTGKEIVGFFNNKEIIHSILECFEVDDMKVTSEILDLLENTLIIGVNEMARLNLTANPFALMILQDSAYKYLEEIQQNNNENISIKANTLIEDYLEGF